jgi:hypothetical protein
MEDYQRDLLNAFTVLDALAAQPGKAVLYSETGAQHFKASDPRGYATGEWEGRDMSTDASCTCKPIEDFNVNARNRVLRSVLMSGKFPHIRTLPFYDLTRPRWRWHFGNWCAPMAHGHACAHARECLALCPAAAPACVRWRSRAHR